MEKLHKSLKSSQISNNSVPESSTPSVKERCPLCFVFKVNFTCEKCISIGNFISTTDSAQATFAEQKEKFEQVLHEKENLSEMCREILSKKTQCCVLPTQEIQECSEKIKTLKMLIQEKRASIEKTLKEIQTISDKNKSREGRLPRYRERIQKVAIYVRQNMRKEIIDKREKLAVERAKLKKVVQKNIERLVQNIFPIEKLNPTAKSGHEEESEMVNELAEASKTSFVRGTWVLMDSSGELHHRIVAPTLPGSGDYTAYLAAENDIPISDNIGQTEAYNISAALCYTTQFVNLLAFYLDINLPKKVSFNDFCNRELSNKQFHRKVAWLNANVLYLCFSQGMDTVLLNPKHTLNNLLNLVKFADLGQTGPFYVDSGVILSLECDEDLRDEGSEDEDGEGVYEWEALPLVACPEFNPGAVMSTTQQSASIAGGLVTSLASMFKGWSLK